MKTSITNNEATLTTTTIKSGDTMSTYSFQPLTKGHRTSDYYLDTWIETMQAEGDIDTLWGRIIRTNINYIATGYNYHGDWVKIPCANLNTAKLHMGRFMSERVFKRHTYRQAQFARLADNRYVCHSY